MSAQDSLESGERQPLLSSSSYEQSSSGAHAPRPTALTISALIRRNRLLIAYLLPEEVKPDTLTSREGIVTQHVLRAFKQLAGDYVEAAPYALLEASRQFGKDAEQDEKALNEQRQQLAIVIARRLVAGGPGSIRGAEILHGRHRASAAGGAKGKSKKAPAASQDAIDEAEDAHWVLLTKYSRYNSSNSLEEHLKPGEKPEESLPRSTLELAVDLGATHFLACPTVQRCVQSLWAGHLIKSYSSSTGAVTYTPYHATCTPGFAAHFDPSRLAVPRYAYYLGIVLWCVLLALYTVQTRAVKQLDAWECLFWVFAAGYLLDDVARWWKLNGLDAVDFWVVIDVMTDALFLTSFVIRMVGLSHLQGSPAYEHWQLRAFQWQACLAPLIWLQVRPSSASTYALMRTCLLTLTDSFSRESHSCSRLPTSSSTLA